MGRAPLDIETCNKKRDSHSQGAKGQEGRAKGDSLCPEDDARGSTGTSGSRGRGVKSWRCPRARGSTGAHRCDGTRTTRRLDDSRAHPPGRIRRGDGMRWDQGAGSPPTRTPGKPSRRDTTLTEGERMRGAGPVPVKGKAGERRRWMREVTDNRPGEEGRSAGRAMPTQRHTDLAGIRSRRRGRLAIETGRCKRRRAKSRPASRAGLKATQLATLVDAVARGDRWCSNIVCGYRRFRQGGARDGVEAQRQRWSEQVPRLVKAAAALPAGWPDDGERSRIGDKGKPRFGLLKARSRAATGPCILRLDLTFDRAGHPRTAEHRAKQRIPPVRRAPRSFGDLSAKGEARSSICKEGGEGSSPKKTKAPYRGARAKTGPRSMIQRQESS